MTPEQMELEIIGLRSDMKYIQDVLSKFVDLIQLYTKASDIDIGNTEASIKTLKKDTKDLADYLITIEDAVAGMAVLVAKTEERLDEIEQAVFPADLNPTDHNDLN